MNEHQMLGPVDVCLRTLNVLIRSWPLEIFELDQPVELELAECDSPHLVTRRNRGRCISVCEPSAKAFGARIWMPVDDKDSLCHPGLLARPFGVVLDLDHGLARVKLRQAGNILRWQDGTQIARNLTTPCSMR